MRYIRRKDNPTCLLKFGYVGPGGLGGFDADIYEEVEGDLPEGYTMEPLRSEQVASTRMTMAQLYTQAPLVLRQLFAPLMSQVMPALDLGDYELASAIIQSADLSPLENTPNHALAVDIQTQLLGGIQFIENL